MPRLYLIPSDAAQRVRHRPQPAHAAVAVTEGLLRQLPTTRSSGVLAHEFAHIKNRDILVSSIAAMVAGAISAIATVLQFSMLFGGSDDDDSPLGLLGTLAAIIIAPIAATLLQLGISRQREYLADATGASCSAAPRRWPTRSRRSSVVRRRSRWTSTPRPPRFTPSIRFRARDWRRCS